MSASGSEIQLRTFPRVNAGRAAAVAVALTATLATGLVIGRITAPSSETSKGSASAPAISTRWIATDAVQLRVMEHMNGLLASETP